MTRVEVTAGACGFEATIEVVSVDRGTVRVVIHSQCAQLASMAPDLEALPWRNGVFRPMAESEIYRIATRHINHPACPIPSAILKAIEVELGIALPRDVRIHFEAP